MIAVFSTRWSSALATFLLMMSTTLQPFLLPTVQASVVPGIVRQMWRPSMDSNTNRALTTGLLGDMPPDAQRCENITNSNPYAGDALELCIELQAEWLYLIWDQTGPEYACKQMYSCNYCYNLVANTFCLPDEYAAYHKVLMQVFADNAKKCKPWACWIPPMDSPPRITNESIKCRDVGDAKCVQEAADKVAAMNITDPTEQLCMKWFVLDKCMTVKQCQVCSSESVKEYFAYYANFWTGKKVECTKWASEEAKFECPVRSTTASPVVEACELLLEKKGEDSRCLKEAQDKTAQIGDAVEQGCKLVYYTADCGMKAACALCNDTKDFAVLARKTLDDLPKECKQWPSDEPKLECASASSPTLSTHSASSPNASLLSASSTTSSTNTLMIVGIIIGVIVLLVVIGVAVYCLCFSSDKSVPSSKAGGGGGSRANSKINSGKAGSTMGSKQQSRASGAAKQQSRASGGAKQQSRIGVKQSSRA